MESEEVKKKLSVPTDGKLLFNANSVFRFCVSTDTQELFHLLALQKEEGKGGGQDRFGEHIRAVVEQGIEVGRRALCPLSPDENAGDEVREEADRNAKEHAERDREGFSRGEAQKERTEDEGEHEGDHVVEEDASHAEQKIVLNIGEIASRRLENLQKGVHRARAECAERAVSDRNEEQGEHGGGGELAAHRHREADKAEGEGEGDHDRALAEHACVVVGGFALHRGSFPLRRQNFSLEDRQTKMPHRIHRVAAWLFKENLTMLGEISANIFLRRHYPFQVKGFGSRHLSRHTTAPLIFCCDEMIIAQPRRFCNREMEKSEKILRPPSVRKPLRYS